MFCKNCGKELCEQAFVCPDCGCLTNNLPEKSVSKAENNSKPMDKKGAVKLLTVISFGCFCLALFFAFLALSDPTIKLRSTSSYQYISIYFWEGYVIPGLILSLGALGTGLTAFILGWQKGTEDTVKFWSLLNFILSATGVFISIAFAVAM